MLDTLKGELRVFTKEVGEGKDLRVIFNTCIGATKQEDDTYINYYVPVNFATALKKEVAKVYKQESFDILLKEGWLKAYKDKDDNTRPVLFINKATIVSVDSEDKPKAKGKAKTKKADADDTDNLPF